MQHYVCCWPRWNPRIDALSHYRASRSDKTAGLADPGYPVLPSHHYHPRNSVRSIVDYAVTEASAQNVWIWQSQFSRFTVQMKTAGRLCARSCAGDRCSGSSQDYPRVWLVWKHVPVHTTGRVNYRHLVSAVLWFPRSCGICATKMK